MDAPPLSEQELTQVYNWVDQIPLSRPKKNITRDFADGGITSLTQFQWLKSYHTISQNQYNSTTTHPQLQQTQNYQIGQLQIVPHPLTIEKVLKKLNYQISKNDMQHIITNTPDTIERVLKVTHNKIKIHLDKNKNEVKEIPKQVQFHKISKNQELKDILGEKDNAIKELKGTVEILELKIQKMEQLIKIKDNKIQSLVSKLQQAGIS